MTNIVHLKFQPVVLEDLVAQYKLKIRTEALVGIFAVFDNPARTPVEVAAALSRARLTLLEPA